MVDRSFLLVGANNDRARHPALVCRDVASIDLSNVCRMGRRLGLAKFERSLPRV